MKVSILMGINCTCRESKLFRDPVECMKELHELGYDAMDVPLDGIMNANYMLAGDDWQQQVERLANEAAKLGVTFPQCHLPYTKGPGPETDPKFANPGHREYFDECMRRSYLAASMLGVKYATAHPLSDTAMLCDMEHQLKINREYYDSYVELGIAHGVGTAFENMRCNSPQWTWPYRYGCHVDDLITLIDSYNDSMVGACWDTGHANAQKQNQRLSINRLGHRLRNLHINDNDYGMRDEHLIPFLGTVDWEDFVEGLVDINFQGVLNYEVGAFCNNTPRELQKIMLRTVYDNAMLLKGMYDTARANRAGKEG